MPELTPEDKAIYQAESDRIDRMMKKTQSDWQEEQRRTYVYSALGLIILISALALYFMNQV